MGHLFFTISFTYDIKPTTLQVDLCADIEVIDDNTCIVRNIQRVGIKESSLLPVMKMTKAGDTWVLSDTGKESNICTNIGEAIDNYLRELSKNRNKMKNN